MAFYRIYPDLNHSKFVLDYGDSKDDENKKIFLGLHKSGVFDVGTVKQSASNEISIYFSSSK